MTNENKKSFFMKTLQNVYKDFSMKILSLSLFISFMLLDYFLLTRTTSWERFIQDNNPIYIWLTIGLSIINNLLIGIVITTLVYAFEKAKQKTHTEVANSSMGIFLSLVSVGCAVCGGFLLPILGIAASLTAFPFQGLEIKVLSILLLLYSFNILSLRIHGIFQNKSFKRSALVGLVFVLFVYAIPRMPLPIGNVFGSIAEKNIENASGVSDEIYSQINPEKGYELNTIFGDLGPRMLAMGVIDVEKFQQLYAGRGEALTDEQLTILTKGTDKKVKITRENSNFLLNFFWAAGLGNKSRVLTEGEMVKYGDGGAGGFASTGGWTLAKSDPMDYYAKETLIQMTPEQEALVEKVSSNIYRPCCGNPTSFPDCNHGMALLSVLQLMASQGATEDEMYEAGKYISAYWFPANYYDLALYFKSKENTEFKDVDPKKLLSNEYSSSNGWAQKKRWLQDQGIVKQPPKGGGGCGV